MQHGGEQIQISYNVGQSSEYWMLNCYHSSRILCITIILRREGAAAKDMRTQQNIAYYKKYI